VRTNFTIPDVHSIALGGGSLVRVHHSQTSVGPDSVGSRLGKESVAFGGKTLTVGLLLFPDIRTESRRRLLGGSNILVIETSLASWKRFILSEHTAVSLFRPCEAHRQFFYLIDNVLILLQCRQLI
jgi:hypothetical protein